MCVCVVCVGGWAVGVHDDGVKMCKTALGSVSHSVDFSCLHGTCVTIRFILFFFTNELLLRRAIMSFHVIDS